MNRLLVLFFLYLPILLMSQTENKYVYNLKLRTQKSTYSITQETQILSNTSIINFLVTDIYENLLPFVRVELGKSTSTYVSITDGDGYSSIELKSGFYSFLVNAVGCSILEVDSFLLKPNSRISIHIVLGKDNSLKHGRIFSVRELSLIELNQIQSDLELNLENELIKNKTCYIVWEI